MSEWHERMMDVARQRWPDMAEHPRIIAASPGSKALDMALAPPDPLWIDLPDKLLEERPLIKYEHIVLEPVGPFKMGYGPQSQTLYVANTHHVTFTEETTIDFTPGNEERRQRAAEQGAAGKSPLVKL